MDPRACAERLRSIYHPRYAFPVWALKDWDSARWKESVVLYHEGASTSMVRRLVTEREPCNIAMERMYDVDAMQATFGWKHGAYREHCRQHPMPNVAVLCNATVKTHAGTKHVWVVNLIGVAHDCKDQPDVTVYHTRAEVLAAYTALWRLALAAAQRLASRGKIDRFMVFNVGGGAFAGSVFSDFVSECFEPSFLPLLPAFAAAGVRVTGYDKRTKTFNGGFIPDVLDEGDPKEVERTLYVNAWDPWSFVGNGNAGDKSLDGHWGRCSNMAVLCWPLSNRHMRMMAVTDAHAPSASRTSQ